MKIQKIVELYVLKTILVLIEKGKHTDKHTLCKYNKLDWMRFCSFGF